MHSIVRRNHEAFERRHKRLMKSSYDGISYGKDASVECLDMAEDSRIKLNGSVAARDGRYSDTWLSVGSYEDGSLAVQVLTYSGKPLLVLAGPVGDKPELGVNEAYIPKGDNYYHCTQFLKDNGFGTVDEKDVWDNKLGCRCQVVHFSDKFMEFAGLSGVQDDIVQNDDVNKSEAGVSEKVSSHEVLMNKYGSEVTSFENMVVKSSGLEDFSL